ncbi:MAG: prepilin-type N-terminal cleavage/methylation domain-containing protein [Elusimicrobia bacterium]|nr:prepilin-type N-terminal cleavage/methylation domain-containing protein [Elusimicrobiota bacterium]
MKKGFTLVEILVVITIILILAGIAVPRMKGFRDEANKAKAKAELKILQAAVESFKNNTGAYPGTTTQLYTDDLGGATPKMVDAVMYDPFVAAGSTEYDYILSDNGVYYVISSVGFDGAGGVTEISAAGAVTKSADDLCVTNGSGC